MFKIFSRPNNNNNSDINTPPGSPSNKVIFADSFWSWYIDSYLINDKQTHIKHTPYNITKYSDKSHDVTTLQKYFTTNKLTPIPSTTQIIAILKSPFTQGDLNKSYYLIRMFQLSSQGLFLTNSPMDKLNHPIQFLGAENWDNVMCYLDALLFAMFANLESFEPILFIPNHSEYLLNQLSALLRVYVNLLRSGNLITTDLTAKICEALMKLGFTEALSHKQQDSATLFEFLTQTLNMPLLTFKIDIKHGGKFSKHDDEKISKERILFVSIPNEEVEDELLPVEKSSISHTEKVDKKSTTTTTTTTTITTATIIEKPPTHQVNDNEIKELPQVDEEDDPNQDQEEDLILLEECLEHYFNNSISVKRELERRATLSHITEGVTATNLNDDGFSSSAPPPPPSSPRVITTPMSNKYEFETIENIDDKTRLRSNSVKSDNIKVGVRQRSSTTLSFWSVGTDNKSNNDKLRRGSTSGKEVSLPAWMFLRLLPFYTDDNVITNELQSVVKTSKEFATRRPILPICLKRYRFNSGAASGTRSQKRIIIPPFIDLPQFVADDIDDNSCSFRLILESAICHRGDKIELGHFIAVVRKHTNKINETEQEANNSTWYLYDDMKKNSRVVEKTFTEIFKDEWPYMLFYRLVSNHEVSGASSINSDNNTNNNNNNNNNNNIVVPPQGSKGNYWLSQEETSPQPLETNNNLSVKTPTKSIPILNVSPIDPKYIDIRNKYYWYFTDDDKNYFKEESIKLKDGNSSFTLSPQFRRNSQWSVNSNISFVQLDKDKDKEKEKEKKSSSNNNNNSSIHTITSKNSNFTKSKIEKPDIDDSITGATNTTTITKPSNLLNKENEIKSSPHSSIWKRAIKLTTSPSVKIDSTESVGELNKQISPINLDTSINDTTTTTTTSLPKTLRNLENNQKKHRHPFSHKKSKSKRQDDYKKEHCIMM